MGDSKKRDADLDRCRTPAEMQALNTLRDRCRRWIERQYLEPAPSDAVDDLQAFVMAEVARSAAPNFETAPALAIFFATIEDRDGFVEMWKQAHPGARSIKVDP